MWNPYAAVETRSRQALGIGSVALVIGLWALAAGLGWVDPAKLPTPWEVAEGFVRLSWDETRGESLLLTATLWSASRVLMAGMVVVTIGVPIGMAMGASPKLDAALSPLVDPFRSAPIVAVLPLLVIWLGIGELMKITFLFLGAVVYLIPMVRDAVRSVPRTYYVSARDLGASPFEAVRHAVLPMAMPRIADAIIVSVSVMWTYITVAEYVNAKKGLGQLIQNAKRFSAMDQVIVGIMVIIALALVTFQLMGWFKRVMYPWEASQ
jgi:ABC-type nitrate/sulfonate/bicarbonate transport system permease component